LIKLSNGWLVALKGGDSLSLDSWRIEPFPAVEITRGGLDYSRRSRVEFALGAFWALLPAILVSRAAPSSGLQSDSAPALSLRVLSYRPATKSAAGDSRCTRFEARSAPCCTLQPIAFPESAPNEVIKNIGNLGFTPCVLINVKVKFYDEESFETYGFISLNNKKCTMQIFMLHSGLSSSTKGASYQHSNSTTIGESLRASSKTGEYTLWAFIVKTWNTLRWETIEQKRQICGEHTR
jgi:hypothetical protein